MSKTSSSPNPPRRPWYRLHLSTWLVLPLGLIVAVLLVLPGGIGRYAELPSWTPIGDGAAVVHGWPLPYLWRKPQGWFGEPASANPSLPWKLADSVREFRLFPLIVDLAIAGIGLVLLAMLVEWRRRRRSRAIQFTLRELLLGASIVAIAFGWWNHQRLADREVRERLSRLGGANEFGFAPRLPLWLRTLAGDDRLSWLGFNGPKGSFKLDWGFSRRQDIKYIVEQFPHDAMVEMDNTVSADDAAAVAAIDRLEQIRCVFQPPTDLTRLLANLERHPHLRNFEYLGGSAKINDAQLAQIATLPQLESLMIRSDASQLTEKGLGELGNCRNLEELELAGARLTDDALVCLAGIKRLRRLDLRGAQFINTDLSTLPSLDRLEELNLWGTNLADDDGLQSRMLPSLRFLNIAGTSMTKNGIIELLDSSGTAVGSNLEQIYLDGDVIDDELIATFKKLRRLRLISFTYVPGGPQLRTANDPNYPQLIQKLQKALPDCVIAPRAIALNRS